MALNRYANQLARKRAAKSSPFWGNKGPGGYQHLRPQSLSGAHANAGAAPGLGKGPKPKPKFNPLKALREIETNKVLTGKDLNTAARALTALELRPQLHGYKQLANQLHTERDTEEAGFGRLGSELQGNVSDVYKNIATSEAEGLARQQSLGQMMNQQSGQIAQQGSQDLAAMQTGQLGDYTKALEMRGAPGGGSAQQELASAVAAQQASQSANSQAAQQFAGAQAASFGSLGAGLAGAGQLQGGEAVSGIGRDVLSRTAASNLKYNEGIQTALGKLADVKALKGATMVKNLLDLRGGEQKFALGQAAVRGEKSKLRAEEAEDAAQNAIDQQKADASSTSAQASLISAEASKWKAHHPEASSGEAAKKRKELKADVRNIRAILPTASAYYKGSKSANNIEAYISYINSKSSAPESLVRKVVKRWWQGPPKSGKGGPRR